MAGKQQRIALTEEFINLFREERSLWDAASPLYRCKDAKHSSIFKLTAKFQMPGKYLFTVSTVLGSVCSSYQIKSLQNTKATRKRLLLDNVLGLHLLCPLRTIYLHVYTPCLEHVAFYNEA